MTDSLRGVSRTRSDTHVFLESNPGVDSRATVTLSPETIGQILPFPLALGQFETTSCATTHGICVITNGGVTVTRLETCLGAAVLSQPAGILIADLIGQTSGGDTPEALPSSRGGQSEVSLLLGFGNEGSVGAQQFGDVELGNSWVASGLGRLGSPWTKQVTELAFAL